MIGHEHIGMNGAAELTRKLFQVMKIQRVIFIGKEARGAIIAPLDDVQRQTGESQARATGHGKQVVLSWLFPHQTRHTRLR